MGRVLFVHPRDLRDAQTVLAGVLRQRRAALVVVAGHDQPPSIANPGDLGLSTDAQNDPGAIERVCRGAEACFVACRPDTEASLTQRFGLTNCASLGHKANPIKADSYRIVEWLRAPPAPPVVVAVPVRAGIAHNYHRQATDGFAGHQRLVLASDALKRASKIAAPIDDCAQFVAFVDEAARALREIATAGASGGLAAVFRRYPAVEFASSGNEAFEYIPPGASQHRTTKLHLKPNRELGGYRTPKQKPRLYFDVQETDAGLVVYVLYLGPHPPTGEVKRVDL